MKSNVSSINDKPLPSFASNPHLYGMPKQRRNEVTLQVRKFVPKSEKPVLPEGYKPELLHRLQPIDGLTVTPNPALKDCVWEVRAINPNVTPIYCDSNYQRELDASDLSFIQEISNNFDYGQFKVPTCFEEPDGTLKCSDGQKSVIAASYHDIEIPVMVIRVKAEESISRQANSFVGINTQQRKARAVDIFSALYFRGDKAEADLVKALKKYGIAPHRSTNGGLIQGKCPPGHTTCINVLRIMHREHGQANFEIMCKLLKGAAYRPIQRVHLYALNILFQRMEARNIDVERMTNAILSIVDRHAILEARHNLTSAKRKSSLSAELANIYETRYKRNAVALNQH